MPEHCSLVSIPKAYKKIDENVTWLRDRSNTETCSHLEFPEYLLAERKLLIHILWMNIKKEIPATEWSIAQSTQDSYLERAFSRVHQAPFFAKLQSRPGLQARAERRSIKTNHLFKHEPGVNCVTRAGVTASVTFPTSAEFPVPRSPGNMTANVGLLQLRS